MHWAIAIPFLVCYTTALILILVYNPHPARPYRQIVSYVHRISGLCLLVVPIWTAMRHRRDLDLYVRNVRQVWSWTLDDVRWLMLIGPASLRRNVSLPHQGKFNAGEKINFMVLTSTYPLYIATGLVIWFGGVPYVSWLAHFSLAVLATPLIFGHIVMATVNPDTRPGLAGMISGMVDRTWARHHYHHWYEEHYGGAAVQEPSVPASVPAVVPVLSSARVVATASLSAAADDSAAATTDPGRSPRGLRERFAGLEAASAAAIGVGAADARAGG